MKINDREAVIGRTVRGFGLVLDDKNTLLNTALQLGSLILPDADPEIKGGTNPPNRNINRNLFLLRITHGLQQIVLLFIIVVLDVLKQQNQQ
ncbi:MAG: hypothetical protein HC908_06025 [Calothrix sp. SM1_7_51]|nr:hypothetical protein [Calothrix sp. SM1_7_51]